MTVSLRSACKSLTHDGYDDYQLPSYSEISVYIPILGTHTHIPLIGWLRVMIITVMGFMATACTAAPPTKTEYVGQMEILEGPVVLLGSTVAGRNWVRLAGQYKTRYLAPDSRYRDIDIGDILIMACTGGNCWVWTVQKKEVDDG